ncbi:MAG: DUF368 domain-containing protein [Saprospiraceae bacterium]|nr:DUF368 domain-containing protein [Saprospiraceae bacterium]HPG06052.1 DUF368 domain-containing protein [Saprospiraceae bacterium]
MMNIGKGSNSWLGIFLRGLSMGIAEVIPGVSGGTIAFISGIYERLLNAIQSFDLWIFRSLFKKGGIKEIWDRVDGAFILTLVGGMASGLLFGVLVISHFLEEYPPVIWGLFFGLISASAIWIARSVPKWDAMTITYFLAGTLLALLITNLSPAEGNTAWWYILISGCIAICALILPGISGSFMLLLLGLYTVVIPAVKTVITDFSMQALSILVFFAIGCLIGLLTFAKLLSWMFKTYHRQTLAAMTGFVVGSLWKIWPWRTPRIWFDKVQNQLVRGIWDPSVSIHDVRVIKEVNVLPSDYAGNPYLLATCLAVIAGITLVFLLGRLDKKGL